MLANFPLYRPAVMLSRRWRRQPCMNHDKCVQVEEHEEARDKLSAAAAETCGGPGSPFVFLLLAAASPGARYMRHSIKHSRSVTVAAMPQDDDPMT
ncbi:hypothetical protein E2C01_076396 [Portunus trituberculatus]|uniref:Uncharacterized protein n=1 Tax=Portunus trituberculatus TaxID=210409 RepID=A0A5B7IHJ9_PORTR|nr:hypothetical protein [Portunus trituberculatus]